MVLAALRAELDEIKGALARRRLDEEQKYRASQPRVPAGNGRESGRWSSGSNGDRPRVVITKPDVDSGDAGDGSGADTGSGASLSAFDVGDVSSEAGSLNLFNITPRDNTIYGGVQLAGDPPQMPDRLLNQHIIQNHVGRTDDELVARIKRNQIPGLFATFGMDRNGTFDSEENARDFIRRTLEMNVIRSGELRPANKARLSCQSGLAAGQGAKQSLIRKPRQSACAKHMMSALLLFTIQIRDLAIGFKRPIHVIIIRVWAFKLRLSK